MKTQIIKQPIELQRTLEDWNKPFNWSLYNKSQTKEKIIFMQLLKELCNVLPEKYKIDTRHYIQLKHLIFCLCMKAYCLKSGRRIIGELEMCHRMGLIKKVPHFNTLFNYLKNQNITPIIQELIKLTSLPLQAVEKKFCGDSTGFGMSILDDKWSQIRSNYEKHHRYMKAHISFGVLSNIVTHCVITDGTQNDSPILKELVDETAKGFELKEFSFDKAYLSRKNMQEIFKHNNCLPFIPFKSNTSGKRSKDCKIWIEMYNFFKKNNKEYMKRYHLRSNAESGMRMIKARFGDLTHIKNEVGAKNDILIKVLCHNLCVLCQEIIFLQIPCDFAQINDTSAQINL
ncbi:MAG: transposase [Nanoarchaeota archaeon]